MRKWRKAINKRNNKQSENIKNNIEIMKEAINNVWIMNEIVIIWKNETKEWRNGAQTEIILKWRKAYEEQMTMNDIIWRKMKWK